MYDKNEEFKKYARKHLGISSLNLHRFEQSFQNMTDIVIEERDRDFRGIPVFARLIEDRIIFIYHIDDGWSNIYQAQLLFLDSSEPNKDISMYINCVGGGITNGLGIYDTMQYISSDVATICTGLAASMGAVLLAAGVKSKRSALRHSRMMIHQPIGAVGGQASNIEIYTKLVKDFKKDLYNVLAEHTGKSIEQIEKDSYRDFWMNAKEAKEYGIVDEVLLPK